MKLYDNEWGFSVDHSNPFRVFPLLQAVAREHGESVIDLSRGDPGYGYAPSVRGREFVSFLLFLDSKLNNPKKLFLERSAAQEGRILKEIASAARSAYVPALAERYLKDLSEFIQRSIQVAKEQGLEWSAFDILKRIFSSSVVSGGTYHNPQGEELIRLIVAWWHQKNLRIPLDYQDLVFTAGASHAIGALFKLFGQEGIQYLNPGDKVLISSPVYSPYNAILERRGLETVTMSVNPLTGVIEQRSLDQLKSVKGIKAIVLIDPNNPTGFSMDESTLRFLADFAKTQNALIISDEVYSSFFEDRRSIVDWCPERTLRIQARSKMERSTGLRFGDVLITKQANIFLTEELLKGLLPEGQDFKTSFIFAKGPGGIFGEFQHTTFVPGPAQFLGAAHILLAEDERNVYRQWMAKNQEVFCKTLGLEHEGNRYYTIFDMDSLSSQEKKDLPPEQRIYELAQQGVVVLPANLFFSEEDRRAESRRAHVRVALANANPDGVQQAAERIRSYLSS
jgi:aspartate/methionine/tyrosine aminotransferase